MNPSPRRQAQALPLATVTRLTLSVPSRRPREVEEESATVQGTLALDLRATDLGPPSTPELDHSHRARVEHVDDVEVRGWAARFAQAVVETVSGQRPASQLVRWTSPEVFRDVDRRAQLLRRAADPLSRPARPPIRPQVRSVHVCRPTADTAEVSVHVRHGHRSRALALRLERSRGRWLCTVLEFG